MLNESGSTQPPTRLTDIHTVTRDEAAQGTFSIEDVVLPLPGNRTRFPEHATAQVGDVHPLCKIP